MLCCLRLRTRVNLFWGIWFPQSVIATVCWPRLVMGLPSLRFLQLPFRVILTYSRLFSMLSVIQLKLGLELLRTKLGSELLLFWSYILRLSKFGKRSATALSWENNFPCSVFQGSFQNSGSLSVWSHRISCFLWKITPVFIQRIVSVESRLFAL